MGDFLRDQWWVVAIFIGTLVPLVRRFASVGAMEALRTLDRRWIFLLMLWSVLFPIYFIGVTGRTFPELPSALAPYYAAVPTSFVDLPDSNIDWKGGPKHPALTLKAPEVKWVDFFPGDVEQPKLIAMKPAGD